METVYLDHKATTLKVEGDALALYNGTKREGTLPLRPMSRLVLVGKVSLGTDVLYRLAKNGISVILLYGRSPRFALRIESRLHRNVSLRIKQYQAFLNHSFRLDFAKEIVVRKLKSMIDALAKLLKERSDISLKLGEAIVMIGEREKDATQAGSIESLRGYEGAAVATYFEALVTVIPRRFGFNGRNRRPPTDPVNALLSLTYTLLHWEMVREIELIGLDPFIGFYHELSYGRESLACDMIEPWRPEADRFVLDLIKNGAFSKNHFARDSEGCYLKKEARRIYWVAYESWARERRNLWRQEVHRLARTIAGKESPLHCSQGRYAADP